MNNASLSDHDTALPLLSGIEEIADNYDAFILDIWGVLHNGHAVFNGVIDCLTTMKDQGKAVLLLSNTPGRRHEIASALDHLKIHRDLYNFIVTAGDSAHDDLKNRQGQRCWFAGGDPDGKTLTQGLDIPLSNGHEDADFILNLAYDMDAAEKAHFHALLADAARNGLDMICPNPDIIVMVGDTVKECPGAYALYYEQQGGAVTYHGKPHEPVYEMAWRYLGAPDKKRILAVGDSLHTDIQGANRFGIDSVFNLSGIHRQECVGSDGRAIDNAKLATLITGQEHSPAFVLDGLKW